MWKVTALALKIEYLTSEEAERLLVMNQSNFNGTSVTQKFNSKSLIDCLVGPIKFSFCRVIYILPQEKSKN